MLWRKGKIIFTLALSLVAWTLFHALLVATRMLVWNVLSLSLFYEIHEKERAAALLSLKYIFTITFWHSSALLPSFRHPTLLHLETIRRLLLINQAQRGYLRNLKTANPSMKYQNRYKNVLLRDFLALSSFCYFCNLSWCCCWSPERFV